MFSVGMGFANLLAAASSLIPALRLICWPIAGLPVLLSLPVAVALGVLFGSGFWCVSVIDPLARLLEGIQGGLQAQPMFVLALILLSIAVPMVLDTASHDG